MSLTAALARVAAVGALPALGLVAANGCSSQDTEPASETAPTSECDGSWESVHAEILAKSCAAASCHAKESAAAALDLSDSNAFKNLIGAPSGTCDGWTRVVPGSPETSLLWRKIYSEAPPCGEPMPLGHFLSAVELGCIREWIRHVRAPDAGTIAPGCETCGGSVCVNLSSSSNHCGACGAACPAGGACTNGECACDGSLTACGSECVDVEASTNHCGRCERACPNGALCSVGECVCPNPLTACNDACVDTQSDPIHCGGCGTACPGGQVCLAGACAAGCGSLSNCNGACVDIAASSLHCGACGVSCPTGASCVSGTCGCPGGTAACGGTCLNILSDPAHCGSCTNACSGGTVCDSGECRCSGGGQSCSGRCIDTQSDPNNCGGCGVTCSGGESCASGSCRCDGGSVSFSGDVQPIFTASCAQRGCHGNVAPKEGLNLSAGAAYGHLVGVPSGECTSRPLVAPGDPSGSYLMNKLMGASLCSGTQMPKAGQSLPKAAIDAIGGWICSGAPDN